MKNKHYPVIAAIGAVLLLAGSVIQITRAVWAPYLYLAGAILFAYTQLTDRYEGANLIIRRLRRQQMIGAALLILAGVMMLFPGFCILNIWANMRYYLKRIKYICNVERKIGRILD